MYRQINISGAGDYVVVLLLIMSPCLAGKLQLFFERGFNQKLSDLWQYRGNLCGSSIKRQQLESACGNVPDITIMSMFVSRQTPYRE